MILSVLVVAFVLGAIHALGPGHGKSLMAAYLVGSTERVWDAVVLAIAITISHVFSVIIVGLITLWVMDFFWPETINKWIGLISGIGIIAIGIWLFIKRLNFMQNKIKNGNSINKKLNSHQHHHHHQQQPNLSFWSNVALGISGGIVPCPKAIVILLLAISLQKIAIGIVIIIVFSLGISITLMIIGIIVVKAGYLFQGKFESKWIQILPIIGSIVIIGLGIILTIRTISIL